MRRWLVLALGAALLAPASAGAQQQVFSGVKVRFSKSDKDRVLVNKKADLVLDGTVRRVMVKHKAAPLDVGYDDVQRIVFDTSRHFRQHSPLLGGLVGAAVASRTVTDQWCYLEYKTTEGATRPYLLQVASGSADSLRNSMRSIFGDRVEIAEFSEPDTAIEKATLKEAAAKFTVRADKQNHPMPELKPDQALVVAVCPTLTPEGAGRGPLFKLHANDRVVVINKEGTYGYAYVDPGEYLLVSQCENANGLKITLEAGKDYYFFQNMLFGAMTPKTDLSRHSKELVMYELNGAYYSEWRPKVEASE